MSATRNFANDVSPTAATSRGRERRDLDPLDDAVFLSAAAGDAPEEEESDELISDDERNANGGALPASDDEDNDNDNDDSRERDIPDHFVREEGE